MWWKYCLLFTTTKFFVAISGHPFDPLNVAPALIDQQDKLLCRFERAIGLPNCLPWPPLSADIATSTSTLAAAETTEAQNTSTPDITSRFGQLQQPRAPSLQILQYGPSPRVTYLVPRQTQYVNSQQTLQPLSAAQSQRQIQFSQPNQQQTLQPLSAPQSQRQIPYANLQQTLQPLSAPQSQSYPRTRQAQIVPNRSVTSQQQQYEYAQRQAQQQQEQQAQQQQLQQTLQQQAQQARQQGQQALQALSPSEMPHLKTISHNPPPIQFQNEPEAINKVFSTKLHQVITSNNPNLNVVYSPISLQTTLSLIYTGAVGQTADELQAALGLPANKAKVLEIFQLLPKSQQRSDFTLSTVGRLYHSQNLRVDPTFLYNARQNFDADATDVDFTRPQAAANEINHWVSQRTNKRIQNLIAPQALDPRTSAILVNAIYFKAKWNNEFSSDETTNDYFSINPQQKLQVRMMNNEDTFRYADMPDYGAKVLQLPYKDTDLSMMIILPNEVNGLAKVENSFQNYDLRRLLRIVESETVRVQLPKFRVEFELDMVEALKLLNIKTLFTNSAQLNGIFPNQPTGISSVKHKAFIDVNEGGTEAAAVTYTKFIPLSLPSNLIHFRVDHPFMFAIVSPQAVYFVGHVVHIS